MKVGAAAVALAVGIACVEARTLCTGEECTSSMQCDRLSVCYATSFGASVGRCFPEQGSRKTKRPGAGQACSHEGDCGPCEECTAGRCAPLRSDEHIEAELAQLGQRAADYSHRLQVSSEQLKQLQSQYKRDEMEIVELNEKLVHKVKEVHNVELLRVVIIGCAVLTSVVSLLVVCRMRRHFGRRAAAAHRDPPTAPLAEAIELSDESSSDDEVAEEEEAALRQEHEGAAEREEFDPEDPNTCKICFDAAINCVLLDCGHMCVCTSCAKRLRTCPVCRKPIRKRKRIFKA